MVIVNQKYHNFIKNIQILKLKPGKTLEINPKNEKALKVAIKQLGLNPNQFTIEKKEWYRVFTLKPERNKHALYQDYREQNRAKKFVKNCIKAKMEREKIILLLYPNIKKASKDYQEFIDMYNEIQASLEQA